MEQNMASFFPSLTNIQLDTIGFLAILGEASVQANAQVTALSRFSFLPRLVPAPQALIRYDRPERLCPLENARAVSTLSGNSRGQLNAIASLLHHRGQKAADYSVRVVRLGKRTTPPPTTTRTTTRRTGTGETADSSDASADAGRQLLRAKSTGPLVWLALLGCAMSAVLLVMSALQRDGMSLIATLCLSLATSVIGVGSKWDLVLPRRSSKHGVPASDVVICYPQGAFLVVQCDEQVQREVFWHLEKCKYLVSDHTYRALSLLATLLLMGGVIFLSNASQLLQILWAGAYIILNVFYWLVAGLPPETHWDLSAYHAEPQRLRIEPQAEPEHQLQLGTLTQALWVVVAVTKQARWASDFDVAPKSQDWSEWLEKAHQRANVGCEPSDQYQKSDVIEIPEWDACQQWANIMETNKKQREAEKMA